MEIFFLILSALVPVAAFLAFIYHKDLNKEPRRLLFKSFAWGMFISLPILIIEYALTMIAPNRDGTWQLLYEAFVVAALAEEGCKAMTLGRVAWEEAEMDEPFDGIVYAVFISLGFAAVENIVYVLGGGFSTSLLRALFSVPGHGLFGVLMGYFFAKARFSSVPMRRLGYLCLSLFVPALFHGGFNYILMSMSYWGGLEVWEIALVYLLFFLALVFSLWRLGLKFIRRHRASSKATSLCDGTIV